MAELRYVGFAREPASGEPASGEPAPPARMLPVIPLGHDVCGLCAAVRPRGDLEVVGLDVDEPLLGCRGGCALSAVERWARADERDPLPSIEDLARRAGVEPPVSWPGDRFEREQVDVAMYWPEVRDG